MFPIPHSATVLESTTRGGRADASSISAMGATNTATGGNGGCLQEDRRRWDVSAALIILVQRDAQASFYWQGKRPAAADFSTVPFELTPAKHAGKSVLFIVNSH